ncbi:Coenzyme Q-binding protein coq10a, mitochondrial [Coemansia sp. RSA 552]|nr:Coenzyme Q-binding protein coq10a, mitochondrial [Coemansia sp. RSA 552]
MNSVLLRRHGALLCAGLAAGGRGFLPLAAIGGGPSARQQRFEQSREFPYSRAQVFDVVADIDKYCEFVPMCTSSAVLHGTRRIEKAASRDPGLREAAATDRHSLQAELGVGFPPFSERYTSSVVLERPWRIVATALPNGGVFRHMCTTWTFAEVPGNAARTRVGFSIEYEFASMLHAQAASLVFDKMARSNIAAYLARCGKLYGSPA